MSYTYATFVTALAQEAAITETNADFVAMLPTFIQNAELQILRDVDLLGVVFRDPAGVVSAGVRSAALPQTYGRFVVIEGVNLFVSGARSTSLTPVSREFIDQLYPGEAALTPTGVPVYYARDNDQTLIFAPSAGATSNVTGFEVVGTVRPSPLSASNTQTFISLYLPDLFLAAAMSAVAGWMKNYGAQADDPKLAVSWQGVYASLLSAVISEEARKRYAAGTWAMRASVNAAN